MTGGLTEPRPWWARDDDPGLPDRLVTIGAGRTHVSIRSLVDERISDFAPVYAQLAEAVDEACAGLARRPWPAVSACGSGIRTAFQPHPPDLDAKVAVFVEIGQGEPVVPVSAAIGLELVPALFAAIERTENLRVHRLHLPWMRPNGRQVMDSALGAKPPWQSKYLWSHDHVAAGRQETPEGALDLTMALANSRLWSLVLSVDLPGVPVSMDVEVHLVPIDPTTRKAHDLLAGYKTSSIGRVFFRERDAFGYRSLERRAADAWGYKPVSGHVMNLVSDARYLYLGGDYQRALKLLIDPTAVSRRPEALELIRREVNSTVWRCRGLSQTLKALAAFEDAGSLPRNRIDDRRAETITELARVLDLADDPNDEPALDRIRTLAGSRDASGWASTSPELRHAAFQDVAARAQHRSHELLRDHEDLITHWFAD